MKSELTNYSVENLFFIGAFWWRGMVGERPHEPLLPISPLLQQPPRHNIIW